jgi:hypothetical protein
MMLVGSEVIIDGKAWVMTDSHDFRNFFTHRDEHKRITSSELVRLFEEGRAKWGAIQLRVSR